MLVFALKARTDAASSALALPDAVYGDQIPVFPGASFHEVMGGSYSDELFGPPTVESLSWFFELDEPVEQVVAWYAERLPRASRASENAETRFAFVPDGAETGESVTVTVGAGRLQITEVVKPGKRTD